jgi:hypothetical protein
MAALSSGIRFHQVEQAVQIVLGELDRRLLAHMTLPPDNKALIVPVCDRMLARQFAYLERAMRGVSQAFFPRDRCPRRNRDVALRAPAERK